MSPTSTPTSARFPGDPLANSGKNSNRSRDLSPPPPYEKDGADGKAPGLPKKPSVLDPGAHSKKHQFALAAVVIILLVCVIVGARIGAADDAYPDYIPLNYTLVDTHQGTDFFEDFDYFAGHDSAGGFVRYSNAKHSAAMNLTHAGASSAILRVDNTQAHASKGRRSVRVVSRTTYSSGLFIFDVLHTPFGCASWPSVKLTNRADWPENGEIDVIEAVNRAMTGNRMTLHTSEGCSMKDVLRKQTGTTLNDNCNADIDGNIGCGVQGPPETFGSGVNEAGGGVYAMEWQEDGIRMWFFRRESIPLDIVDGVSPRPDTWGEPLADFPSTDCSIGAHFGNLRIVADIDVCGTRAGEPEFHSKGDSCPGNCRKFAASNPKAFDNSYWEFKSFKVYQATTGEDTDASKS